MIPPPISVKFFGTVFNDKAPVDETINFSSILIPGTEITSEPVAIIIFFVLITSVLPSRPVTVTSFGPVIFS